MYTCSYCVFLHLDFIHCMIPLSCLLSAVYAYIHVHACAFTYDTLYTCTCVHVPPSSSLPYSILPSLSPSSRLKLTYQGRLELCVGNEVLRATDDRRLVSAIPLRDRMVRTLTCIATAL